MDKGIVCVIDLYSLKRHLSEALVLYETNKSTYAFYDWFTTK